MRTHSKAAPLHRAPSYRQLFQILQLKFHMKFSGPCKCDIRQTQKKNRMNILQIGEKYPQKCAPLHGLHADAAL